VIMFLLKGINGLHFCVIFFFLSSSSSFFFFFFFFINKFMEIGIISKKNHNQ
jgi:hypothetical protein